MKTKTKILQFQRQEKNWDIFRSIRPAVQIQVLTHDPVMTHFYGVPQRCLPPNLQWRLILSVSRPQRGSWPLMPPIFVTPALKSTERWYFSMNQQRGIIWSESCRPGNAHCAFEIVCWRKYSAAFTMWLIRQARHSDCCKGKDQKINIS